MPSIANLATNSALNAKIKEFKDKVPSITNLTTTAALTAALTTALLLTLVI